MFVTLNRFSEARGGAWSIHGRKIEVALSHIVTMEELEIEVTIWPDSNNAKEKENLPTKTKERCTSIITTNLDNSMFVVQSLDEVKKLVDVAVKAQIRNLRAG